MLGRVRNRKIVIMLSKLFKPKISFHSWPNGTCIGISKERVWYKS